MQRNHEDGSYVVNGLKIPFGESIGLEIEAFLIAELYNDSKKLMHAPLDAVK